VVVSTYFQMYVVKEVEAMLIWQEMRNWILDMLINVIS
jgi:hypothetical protein